MMGPPAAQTINKVSSGSITQDKKFKVVFVLGGPGSGKGTQCANIAKQFGFTHLSVGDLLRAEIRSGSENSVMIETLMKDGKIVPSEITVKLLQQAMRESGNDKFLIDGFPRNEENRVAFENAKIEPDMVLFLDCPVEEMERRLINRNQGREDDNMETIRKRFKVFNESTLPVIEFYNLKGKTRKIDAGKPADKVFEDIKGIFSTFTAEENAYKKPNISTIVGFEHIMCLVKRLIRYVKKLWRSFLCKVVSPEYLMYYVS